MIRLNNIKLLKNKKIIFFIILTVFMIVCINQIHKNNIKISIIEPFDIDDSDLKKPKIVDIISNFFKPNCLTGCMSPTSENNSNCEKVYDENNNYHYECSWKCDIKKFNNFLEDNPDLKAKLVNYKQCSPENEEKDCGSCRPKRSFFR